MTAVNSFIVQALELEDFWIFEHEDNCTVENFFSAEWNVLAIIEAKIKTVFKIPLFVAAGHFEGHSKMPRQWRVQNKDICTGLY